MPVCVGMSGATVERWTKPGEPDRYLKSSPRTWDHGLDAEAARLRWLATTPLAARVATVVHHEVDRNSGDVERLLTTAVPGTDGAALAETAKEDEGRRDGLAFAYGAALRELHESLDPADCPFDERLEVRLAAAAQRVAEGGVDAADFEPEHTGRTPEAILAELQTTRPDVEDVVVVHGDWCYPNVLFGDDGWWGMVDLASLGVSCRWHDLGIGARSTGHNLGDAAVPAFLAGYGLEPEDVDHARLRYYVLLDELQ